VPGMDATASVRLHPYLAPVTTTTGSGTSFFRVGQSAQLVSLGTEGGSSSRVLVLSDADGNSTTALANSIAAAGFLVTVRPAPENTWNGTDPSLDGFDLVIHLNGNTVGTEYLLNPDAQAALVNFVRSGGGFIGSQWSGYETMIGQGAMQDLALMGIDGPENENCFICGMTYSHVPELQNHPVLAGIPSSFTFVADGHASGDLTLFESNQSVTLMRVPSGLPGVAVRSLDAGKVVNFSFAPNYGSGGDGRTLVDPNIQQLYVNAVRWAARSATQPTKTPATITLADPAATYDGTAHAVSVLTNPAGLTGVTVTYSQDGIPVSAPVNAGTYQVLATLTNDDYEAPQATGTLTIRRATPVIEWANPVSIVLGTPLSATELNARVTGVGGAAIAGEFVYLPGAGTILSLGNQPLSVEFLSWNGNYTNAIKTVQILVSEPSSGLTFRGFFLPIRNMPTVNSVPAGAAIPVRFSVEGAQAGRVLKEGSPTSVSVACKVNARVKDVLETADEDVSQLLSRGNSYTYIWKTSASWSDTCRKLVVTLADGSKHEAVFRFGKAQKAKIHRPSKKGKEKGSSEK
jgi:hypothetical protein